MSLKEVLAQDLKKAMKEKNQALKDAVQMVRAAVLQFEKDKKVTLDDNGVVEIVAKEVKKRRDSLPDYEKSGRQDLVDKLKMEIDALMKYLPKQLNEEEVEELVKTVIEEVGAKTPRDMGKVMQKISPMIKGKADGKLVSSIVKKFLG